MLGSLSELAGAARRRPMGASGRVALEPIVAARLASGSIFRGGARIVCAGATDGVQSVAAGATTDFEVKIIEDMHLRNLVIATSGEVGDLSVTGISWNNDGLVNGEVPAAMFSADNPNAPLFGHFVSKNSTLIVSVKNDNASAANVGVGFTALEADSR